MPTKALEDLMLTCTFLLLLASARLVRENFFGGAGPGSFTKRLRQTLTFPLIIVEYILAHLLVNVLVLPTVAAADRSLDWLYGPLILTTSPNGPFSKILFWVMWSCVGIMLVVKWIWMWVELICWAYDKFVFNFQPRFQFNPDIWWELAFVLGMMFAIELAYKPRPQY